MSAAKYEPRKHRKPPPPSKGKVAGKLTAKQARFCEEYLVDGNAAGAARRAGYSDNTAQIASSEILRKPHIAERIAELQAAVSRRTEITVDRVRRELGLIAFANVDDFMGSTMEGDPYIDVSKLTRDQKAAIAEFTVEDFVEGRGEDARAVRRVKMKLWDKRAALVDLGRHLGMFDEKMRLEDAKGDPLATLYRQIVGAPGARSILDIAREAAAARQAEQEGED